MDNPRNGNKDIRSPQVKNEYEDAIHHIEVKIERMDEDPNCEAEDSEMKVFKQEEEETSLEKDVSPELKLSLEQEDVKPPFTVNKLPENESKSLPHVESSDSHSAVAGFNENKMTNLPIENVHVKVEPTWYSDDDDSDEEDNIPIIMLKNSMEKMDEKDIVRQKHKKKKYTRLVPINHDDTLPFKLQTKPLKPPPKPSASRKNCENAKLMFTEDVVERIEIVTISEEQRAAEHLTQWEARKHMRYTCRSCAMGFVTHPAYEQHLKVHDPQESGAFQCTACGQCVRTASALYKHRLRHYRRYRCTDCGATYRDKEAAAAHVNIHIGRTFPCDLCNINFKRPLYLHRHWLQQHSGDDVPAIPCPSPGCPKVFRERSQYRTHVRQHNEEVRSAPLPPAQYACPFCPRRFAVRSYLRKHVLTHDRTSLFHCTQCAHVTFTKNALATHTSKHHNNYSSVGSGVPPAICSECGVTCATVWLLRVHKRQMHGIDSRLRFECDECGQQFARKKQMRKHIAADHTEGGYVEEKQGKVRTHLCECSRMFRDADSLARHIAKCHDEDSVKYTCSHCGKVYETSHQQKRHETIHTDEKLYACDECGERFRSKDYVKIHHQLRHLNMTRKQLKELKMQRMREREEREKQPRKRRRRNDRQKGKVEKEKKPPLVRVKIERETVEDLHVPEFGMFEDILEQTG